MNGYLQPQFINDSHYIGINIIAFYLIFSWVVTFFSSFLIIFCASLSITKRGNLRNESAILISLYHIYQITEKFYAFSSPYFMILFTEIHPFSNVINKNVVCQQLFLFDLLLCYVAGKQFLRPQRTIK